MKTKDIVLTGVMASVICVISLLQLPLSTGVPVTLQVFAVALSGYILGRVRGSVAVLIYIAVGLVGVPVFSGYMGGFSAFFGPTGGFIAGFFPIALLSGLGRDKKAVFAILLGFLGLMLCHVLGAFHYRMITDCSLGTAFLAVSLPYIIKDMALIAGAYFLSLPIKKRILKNKGTV